MPTAVPTPKPSITPKPTDIPTSLPSPEPTVAPVAAPIVFTEAQLRTALLDGGFDADLNATITLTSTLVLADSSQELKSNDGTGKLIGDGTFRLIDITGPTERRRLGLDEATVSSEVRLKHLELILGAEDDDYGGAIRVSWPASLYAHDVTFTANSATRGGAVYVHATFARLDHCLFRRNNASEVGGVAYAAGDVVEVDGAWRWAHVHGVNDTHAGAAGAKLKVTHGTLSENRARAGAAFAAFYAHLEIKHTRAFYEWDFLFGGDQEIHLMENGTGYGCHNEPHFNFTGNKVGWERCWDSSDEASMLLYKLAILCMIIIAGIAAGGCVIGSIRLTYGYLFQHWKCPDLGALGGRLWYDDHRGECYCGVFFATCFSAIALVFAFLASGEDPNLVEAFGYARLDTTDPSTYLIIGLNGFVVVADEIGEDDTVADESLDGNKVYVPFGKSFGDDDAAGSDYDWTGMCATAGEQAYGALYPILFVKLAAAFIVYRRVDTEKDSWYWKFAGVGVECLATVLVLNMLVYFSFDCLMQLPTGAFFVPASDDTEAAYAYADDDPGTSYAVDAAYPYTSFIFTIVSGLCSLFVAYVHWRTPTWNSEMVEKLY
jgi:predicted outer membrane repeat protein